MMPHFEQQFFELLLVVVWRFRINSALHFLFIVSDRLKHFETETARTPRFCVGRFSITSIKFETIETCTLIQIKMCGINV